MRSKPNWLFIIIFSLLSLQMIYGQEQPSQLQLPTVFLIGEYEEQYTLLYEEYNEILLSVCHDDMHVAFNKWILMLTELEAYAQSVDYDLQGIKLWLKVFWNQDGTIDYISYYPKPKSRVINFAEITAVLKGFCKVYEPSIEAKVRFTHHGSAQFPISTMPRSARKD